MNYTDAIIRTTKLLFVVVITFSLMFVSCGVPKPIGPQVIDPPSSFAHAGLIDTVSLGDIDWNSFFTEPALQELVNMALESNFDIRMAITNCEMAQQALKTIRLSWLPDVNVGAYASSDKGNPSRFSVGGNFQWEADLWAKTKDRVRGAHAGVQLSREELNVVRTAVVAQTASLFYTLHWLERQLGLFDQQIALNDSLVSMQQALFLTGKAPSTTVNQLVAQGKSLEIARSNTDKLKENALHALTALLGRTELEWVAKHDLEPLVVPGIAIGVPANLLSNRPDLRAAEQSLQIANAELNIARKNFYPSITITGSGGWSAETISSLFTKGVFGVVDGTLAQPLFNRRRIKGEYEQAKIRKTQAEIEFERRFVEAFAEVDDALLSAARILDQRQLSCERLQALDQALYDGKILYRTGRITYIELLSLQRDNLDTQLKCVELDKEYQLSLIELYRALGGGWE